MKTTLSIVIVNWRSKDYLRACLASIGATAAALRPQIIVVDGASFDGCAQMLAADFPEVEFVQSQENLGFGKCNNLGCRHATGTALLLINPDTEVRPGALESLIAELNRLPDAGLLAPRLLNTDGSVQESCVQPLPTPLNQALDSRLLQRLFSHLRLWGNRNALASDEPTAVEAVSGACMLMREEVFRRVGGFSPEYFMYGEDLDLCAKVGKLGLKVYHVPGAQVVHHGGRSSTGSFSRSSPIHMRHSVYLFIRRHQGCVAAAIYRAAMACSSIVRLCLIIPSLLVGKYASEHGTETRDKWLSILQWSLGFRTSSRQ